VESNAHNARKRSQIAFYLGPFARKLKENENYLENPRGYITDIQRNFQQVTEYGRRIVILLNELGPDNFPKWKNVMLKQNARYKQAFGKYKELLDSMRDES